MSALAKTEIKRRLEQNEIFVDGTWDSDCLRNAGYDLRVAPDYLIAPDGTRFWPKDPNGRTACNASFQLNPGEIAFVSSVERLCMPFDLTGNIAQKFTISRNGLLVLGGLLVDPGYGLELRDDGRWWVKEDQRLHFQLANVGAEKFTIIPGKTSIAGIQFLPLVGLVKGPKEPNAEVEVPDSEDLLNDLFVQGDGEPLAPFAFFPRMAELGRDLDSTRGQVDDQEIRLESTKRSMDQLLVFGVLGLVITLFTVACAALIEAIASGSTSTAAEAVGNADIEAALSYDGLVLAALLVGILIVFAVFASLSVITSRALSRPRRARSRKKA